MIATLLRRLSPLLSRLEWAAWLALVVSLPITSLPLISALAGGSMVAPPAGVLALLFFAVWLIPQWVKGRSLPRHTIPLLAFCGAVLLSGLAAYFIEFPAFRSVNFTRSQVVELATLAVGVCTYLVTASYLSDERRMLSTLRWLNWSGLAVILWSVAQFLSWQLTKDYPLAAEEFQNMISVSRLYAGRVTGFALEPSWLAHQLNMLYLPLWLAATVRRFSAHGWRIFRLSFENFLLAAGVGVLWFSLSRVGLVSFLLMVALVFILLNVQVVGWLERRILKNRQITRLSPQAARRLLRVILSLILIFVYIAMLAGVAFMLSKLDWRMARLFDLSTLTQDGLMVYANQLIIAERIVFWQMGWDVFNDHPFLGVGLSNAGYFFSEKLSSYGYGLIEVTQILYRETGLPNTKALWVRLLAETGLLGFALFSAWLLLQWAGGADLSHSPTRLQRSLGLAAQFVVLGLLVEGFSVDTFALPYYWFALGAAAAVWKLSPPNPKHRLESASP
jgi:O-antigen ligase